MMRFRWLSPPWQFDWKVTWSGRTNVYSFVLNNRKFNLLPQPLDECTSSPSACLAIAKFEHELEGAVMKSLYSGG